MSKNKELLFSETCFLPNEECLEPKKVGELHRMLPKNMSKALSNGSI